jgi:hypothetical protein
MAVYGSHGFFRRNHVFMRRIKSGLPSTMSDLKAAVVEKSDSGMSISREAVIVGVSRALSHGIGERIWQRPQLALLRNYPTRVN